MISDHILVVISIVQGIIGFLFLIWKQSQQSLKIDVLWKIHEEDMLAVARSNNLIKRASAYTVKLKGQLPKELIDDFRELCKKPHKDGVALRKAIIERVGWEDLHKHAHHNGITPGLYLTWWVVAIQQAHREGVENFIYKLEHDNGITLTDTE